MKKLLLPVLIIISLTLVLFSGCQASIDKAEEYYNGLKDYVEDAKDVVEDFGKKAGDAIDGIGDFFTGDEKASGDDTAGTEAGYTFRTQEQFDQHYQKHGSEFGSITQAAYLALANEVISDPDSLRKQEADGDSLFYDEDDNEFAVLSSDGYIRTLFRPDDGIEYWNRQ